MWTKNLQMSSCIYKWKKNQRSNCQYTLDYRQSKGIPKEKKKIYFCFTDYAKAFDCVEILKEMRIPDHFTCLLRNLYASQEATVRTGHGTTDWFLIGIGVLLFNLYAEYIMWNARLDEAQAGIKIARRNINNLRCVDDTTLMAKSEELKSLLMKMKEKSEKAGLKINI